MVPGELTRGDGLSGSWQKVSLLSDSYAAPEGCIGIHREGGKGRSFQGAGITFMRVWGGTERRRAWPGQNNAKYGGKRG